MRQETLLLEAPKASLDGFHRYCKIDLCFKPEGRVDQYIRYLDAIKGHGPWSLQGYGQSETKYSKHSHWGPYNHWIECHWGQDEQVKKPEKKVTLPSWLKKHHPEVYQEYRASV